MLTFSLFPIPALPISSFSIISSYSFLTPYTHTHFSKFSHIFKILYHCTSCCIFLNCVSLYPYSSAFKVFLFTELCFATLLLIHLVNVFLVNVLMIQLSCIYLLITCRSIIDLLLKSETPFSIIRIVHFRLFLFMEIL